MKENLTCEACERELIAFLDGALTPAVARVIERHVQSCARCGAALEDYRALAAHLRAMPLIAAPAGLEERVVRAMLGPRRFLAMSWQRLAAGLAAASFALGVAFLAYLPQLAGALHLPHPSSWTISALSWTIRTLTTLSKRFAADVAFYEPIVSQVWIAVRSLEDVPRVVLVSLRAPEAQVAGVILLTLGFALYMMLRPSRRHEGSVGHVCLSL